MTVAATTRGEALAPAPLADVPGTTPDDRRAPRRDTTLLRALAALLVTNSHLEHFYPYAWLAGDGLVGNSLFFLLAGYGLESSARQELRHFWPWMRRRIGRLYPTVILVVVAFGVLLGGGWKTWSAKDFVSSLVWPTRFTFVELVVPFYLLFYPVQRTRRPLAYLWAAGLLVPVYAVAYAADVHRLIPGAPLRLGERSIWVHVAAYLQLMFVGAWFATPSAAVPRVLRRPGVVLALGIAYLSAKLAFVHGVDAAAYGVLHALTLALCAGAFALLTREDVVRGVRGHHAVWTGAAFVGALTLEVYVVHSYTADYGWLWRVPFPANIGLFWLLTLPLAALVQRLTTRLRPGALRPGPAHARPAQPIGVPGS